MSLADLIRGRRATAIPATFATEGWDKGLSVARIATIAVANPSADVTEIERDAIRYGVTLADIREVAGDDWQEVEADPVLFEAVCRSIATRRMRERGVVPPHYTAKTICAHCGAVPVFPGVPERVAACPWCFNRNAGRPLPSRTTVTPKITETRP